ncbi:hypothetical protein [Brevundimonas sp.]|uniref:hypothetical protein n=1 Tax=Brevundimonas sp. TaxID=1871086 RepID=UPI002633DC35|nr:hypothetical protein [Brevundimonas sp.]
MTLALAEPVASSLQADAIRRGPIHGGGVWRVATPVQVGLDPHQGIAGKTMRMARPPHKADNRTSGERNLQRDIERLFRRHSPRQWICF